jgi:L-alanine-DL-glutamate epimerase-like enolase superfamily enzyme
VSVPNRSGGSWPDYKAAAADVCLWDILGKAVNRPIYQLLGGKKDRMMAYASSSTCLPSKTTCPMR